MKQRQICIYDVEMAAKRGQGKLEQLELLVSEIMNVLTTHQLYDMYVNMTNKSTVEESRWDKNGTYYEDIELIP